MKRLLPATIFVVVAAYACGSEDTGDTSSSPSSSGTFNASSSGGTSGTSSSGGAAPIDGGKCQIATLGFDPGTVVTNVPRTDAPGGNGGVPWTDLDNAKSRDDAFAKVTLAAGEQSQELRITGFDFKLPAGAVFQGVEARLDRRAPEGGIADGYIALVGVKNQVGRGKFIGTPWPTSIVGTHHYGQATDTWGMDLNPPDVQTPEFGVGIWVKRTEDGSGPANASAFIDSLNIRVAFCVN